MQPVLSRRQVEVDIAADVAVQADPQALERILRNLLGTATRHTPAGGTLTVAAAPDGEMISIEVSDTGEGIPAELLPTVLEEFQSEPHGRTGLGFGLAIVKEYVELHGGTIHIGSQVGEGHHDPLPATRRAVLISNACSRSGGAVRSGLPRASVFGLRWQHRVPSLMSVWPSAQIS